MKNLLNFKNYNSNESINLVNAGRIDESNLFESVKYIDFESLNEQQREDIERICESKGLCTFDLICMQDGIGYNEYGIPLTEREILEEEEMADEELNEIFGKVFGFAKKIFPAVKKVFPKIINKVKTFAKSPRVASLINKFKSGVGKLFKSKDIEEPSDIAANADETPELAQVADVSQKSLGKVLDDIKSRGAGALFSMDNYNTLKNVTAQFQVGSETGSAIKKTAKAQGEEGEDEGEDDESGL
jgi:hypothetical protein